MDVLRRGICACASLSGGEAEPFEDEDIGGEMVAAGAEAAALLKLLGLLRPARCRPSAPISPIPLPTAPATVTTPFSVLLRNSRPLPSPLGAQVCSHASERSAADSNESKAGLRLVVNEDERR